MCLFFIINTKMFVIERVNCSLFILFFLFAKGCHRRKGQCYIKYLILIISHSFTNKIKIYITVMYINNNNVIMTTLIFLMIGSQKLSTVS